jgi:AcrR family transcriptional regulator
MARTHRKLSEGRRAQILSAAADVIVERGLCDTRVSDIAVRAGTSSALVLYYFESKDRLLAEALAFSEERFYSQTAEELAGIESARDQLVRLIALSCSPGPGSDQEWLDEWVLWLDLWARAPRDPDVARDREALDRRWREAIAEIVRNGRERGEFKPVDPDDFALRLAVMIDGLAIQVVLGDPDVDMARMFDICVRMASTELGFAWAADETSRVLGRKRSAGSRRRAPTTGVRAAGRAR